MVSGHLSQIAAKFWVPPWTHLPKSLKSAPNHSINTGIALDLMVFAKLG